MLFLDSSQASGSLSKPVARLLPWVTNPRPGWAPASRHGS